MLEATTRLSYDSGHTDVSFSTSGRWDCPPALDGPGDVAIIQFGAETLGPILYLIALGPDVYLPDFDAHSHDSDSWRMSLRGALKVGHHSYGPGEFRFQAGRRVYPSDNGALGPDGGWTVLVMADRRGSEPRWVRSAEPADEADEMDPAVAEQLSAIHELFYPGADDSTGASCLATTLGSLNNAGYLSGSFADMASWRRDQSGRAVASAALGDAVSGPLFVLSSVPAMSEAMPGCTLDTEVVRVVVEGSCTIGTAEYRPGDLRIQHANAPCEPAYAGAQGLKEVVIFGERQAVLSQLDAGGRWPAVIADDLGALEKKVGERTIARPGRA